MASIVFDASMDLNEVKNNILNFRSNITKLVEDAVKGGAKIDDVFNEIGKTVGSVKAVVKSLDNEMATVFGKLKEATKTGAVEQADALTTRLRDLRTTRQDAIKVLDEATQAEKDLVQVEKEEGEITETLSGQIGGLVKSWGGAVAMLQILKKAFQETAGGMNFFNSVGAVTDQVLYDIVSGQGVSSGRAGLAARLQGQKNMQRWEDYADNYKASVYENKYQQLYGETLDASLSRTDKISKIDDALEAHEKAVAIRIENIKKNLELNTEARELQPQKEKLIKEYFDLNTQLQDLEAQRIQSTKKLRRQRSVLMQEEIEEQKKFREEIRKGLQDMVNDINEKAADKLKSVNDELELSKLSGMEKDLKKLEQQYKKDIEVFGYNQVLKSKITALYLQERRNVEMKYLEDWKKDTVKVISEIEKMFPGKGYSILNKAITNTGGTPAKFGWKDDLAPSNIKRETENEKQRREDIEKAERKRRENMMSMVDLMGELSNTLEDQNILTKEGADQFRDMVTAAGRLISGDFLGAGMTVLQNLIINIQRTFPSVMTRESERLEAKIAEINKLLEDQRRIIGLSDRKGGKVQAQDEEGSIIQKEIDANNAAIEKYQNLLNDPLRFYKTKQKASEAIIELTEKNKDLQVEIEDSRQALQDLFAGGITENTFADAIAEGFRQGKTSAKDFADYVNDVLLDATMNVFKEEILGPQLTNLANFTSEALKDKVLTPEEKSEIDRRVKEISDSNKALWDGLTGPLEFGRGPQPGLSGAISRSITEETGPELAGLFRRNADDTRQIKDYAKSGINHLINIERNTYATAENTKETNKKLDKIISNTNQNFENK